LLCWWGLRSNLLDLIDMRRMRKRRGKRRKSIDEYHSVYNPFGQ